MGKAYPHFHSSYFHEELVEHFLLTPAELHFVLTFRGEPNRCGIALLLKVLPYLGYVPDKLSDIPQEVRAFITGQLGLLWDRSDDYPWHTSTRDYHAAQVRKCTGWRFLTAQDKIELEQWLRQGAAYEGQSAEMLLDAACGRLRRLRVELPAEGELQRLVLLERLAVGRRRVNSLDSRVDRLVADLWIFRPVRDQTPPQRIQASLLGFRIIPNGEDVLARSNVPTDRQVALGRNRDTVTPR